MKRIRFTEEQIIAILREEAGAATADVCRKHGVSSATFYKWKAKYDGLDVSDARRLKALVSSGDYIHISSPICGSRRLRAGFLSRERSGPPFRCDWMQPQPVSVIAHNSSINNLFSQHRYAVNQP